MARKSMYTFVWEVSYEILFQQTENWIKPTNILSTTVIHNNKKKNQRKQQNWKTETKWSVCAIENREIFLHTTQILCHTHYTYSIVNWIESNNQISDSNEGWC